MGKLGNFGGSKSAWGWSLKNILLFSKTLAAKSCSRLVTRDNLWTSVVIQKYIHPELLVDWIKPHPPPPPPKKKKKIDL
jgi:hypothetical protein